MLVSGQPDPPFVEFHFYFHHLSSEDSFRHVLRTLLRLEASSTGEALVHRLHDEKPKAFEGPSDFEVELLTFSPDTVLQVLDDPGLMVMKMYMRGVVPGHPNKQILTYDHISAHATQVDHHPITIWMEGTMFDPIPEFEELSLETGLKIYEGFKQIVNDTYPSYAMITIEMGMSCPVDISRRGGAVGEFFLSKELLSTEDVAHLKDIYSEDYAETLPKGLYLSDYFKFNPERRGSRKAQVGEVAKIIVEKLVPKT